MKIRFNTQVKTEQGIMPAGTVVDMPSEKAKKFIERGLAVPMNDAAQADEESAAKEAAKAQAKASREATRAAKEAAKRAAEEAPGGQASGTTG